MGGRYALTVLRTRLTAALDTLRGTSPAQRWWNQRVARHGENAGCCLSVDDHEIATAAKIAAYTPLLEALAAQCFEPGPDRVALDFGCGAGRFTGMFARACGGRAIGCDTTAGLIRHARKRASSRLAFAVMPQGRIPFEDASIDLVGCVGVLGGLQGDDLALAVSEVVRVLRPGGGVFLEETAEGHASGHWRGRAVAEYAGLFAPAVEINSVGTHLVEGRRLNLMTGKKHG